MLDEKAIKQVWRVGKVDSIKVGRDGKVREVNVAYKILKEESNDWTHNVVTRPVRKIIKLFEIQDTTFAEEMKAVQEAAKTILKERGSLNENEVPDVTNEDNTEPDLPNPNNDQHSSFLHCLDVHSWYELDTDHTMYRGGVEEPQLDVTQSETGSAEDKGHTCEDEILFLV